MKRKNIKLKACPICEHKQAEIWHTFDGTLLTRWKYFIMCPSCHWCSKKKLFLWRAARSWNRRDGV